MHTKYLDYCDYGWLIIGAKQSADYWPILINTKNLFCCLF